MSHLPAPTSSLWAHLLALDRTFLEEVQARGCPHCGSRLDRADYRRKPRGCPDRFRSIEDFDLRFALSCSAEGCRRRTPVPSARFAGPRVYVAVAIILTTALRQAPPPRRRSITDLVAAIPGISRRTVQRWVAHWNEAVPRSRWWKALAGRLHAATSGAAHRLVAAFDAWADVEAQTLMLRCATVPSR